LEWVSGRRGRGLRPERSTEPVAVEEPNQQGGQASAQRFIAGDPSGVEHARRDGKQSRSIRPEHRSPAGEELVGSGGSVGVEVPIADPADDVVGDPIT
jgi:hypothetical protein